MELCNKCGDLFTIVSKPNNVYPVKLTVITLGSGFTVWMSEGDSKEQTHQEVVKHLDNFLLVAMARGGQGSDASLLMWHCRLGHPLPKTIINLSKSGFSNMVIADVPAAVPTCMVSKLVHLSHKEGQFLERSG